MFYPHADDENVAMGYANYNHKEEDGMVTIDGNAFKSYIFSNYIDKLEKDTLLDMLEANVELSVLVDMSRHMWELPFELKGESTIVLTDANELLRIHTESALPDEDCFDCPEYQNIDDDDDDYDIVINDDDDWDDEEFAPYDELDDLTEEVLENEEA